MQDAPKAVWSIVYVSVAFFPSLKQNFIANFFSKVSSRPECIFKIHQLWQSGFSRVYSKCCCSFWFEPEIIKIGQSSHKMNSDNIVNFQESTTIWNACTKKSGNLLKEPPISFGLGWFLWHINHCRLFNTKSSFIDNTHMLAGELKKLWDMKVIVLFVVSMVTAKGICPKVNVIARLEYELTYYDSAVHRFNHYTTRKPPSDLGL